MSSAGVYGWLRWAGFTDSLGICNADGDGTARGFDDLFHYALEQKMAGSTESTGGLRPGTDGGSMELHEYHATRAPPVLKLLVDTKEKVPDNFIVQAGNN